MRRSPVANLARENRAIADAKAMTPEAVAKRDADREAFNQRFLAEINARSGSAKIKDRDARVAVEGDTDLNHDNLEG